MSMFILIRVVAVDSIRMFLKQNSHIYFLKIWIKYPNENFK